MSKRPSWPDSLCPALAEWGGHVTVVVYSRSWRHLWRKRRYIRCWKCELRIPEP